MGLKKWNSFNENYKSSKDRKKEEDYGHYPKTGSSDKHRPYRIIKNPSSKDYGKVLRVSDFYGSHGTKDIVYLTDEEYSKLENLLKSYHEKISLNMKMVDNLFLQMKLIIKEVKRKIKNGDYDED